MITKKEVLLHFCCDPSQSTFLPSSNNVYSICIFFWSTGVCTVLFSMSVCMLFCASITQNFSPFAATSLGVSDCLACLKDDFGFLWYIVKILALTLISFPKSEYLSILILDANVSLSSLLKCLFIVDAILINSGSCSFVNVLCIGHSDSGNSRKLGPFCQVLSKFSSLGFLPRVSQSAMLYLLSIRNHSLGFVFCSLSGEGIKSVRFFLYHAMHYLGVHDVIALYKLVSTLCE